MTTSKSRSATTKPPSGDKSVGTPGNKSPAKTEAAATPPATAATPADKNRELHSLFVRESGTDDYAIFGPHGPVLWSKGLDLSKDDLMLWRKLLQGPAALAGAKWRSRYNNEEYDFKFVKSSEVAGHIVAEAYIDDAKIDGGEVSSEGLPIFVGAKHGNLFMIFAGWPTSFADCDFQRIYDELKRYGVAG